MFNKFIDPIITSLDAETEHVAILEFLHVLEASPDFNRHIARLRYKNRAIADIRLQVKIGNLQLNNPLLVGAGWDKIGHSVRALYELGFAGVEVGSVMQHPQEGNPKPRHFWLAPGVAMQRYGFNSPGMEVTAQNLDKYANYSIPIGINIGKNKDITDTDAPQTYAAVAKRLYKYGSYFVINVSSPNTPGLRKLQEKKPLTEIVCAVKEAVSRAGERKPLFVKIAPDMSFSQVDDVIDVVMTNNLTGIIATNTSLNTNLKKSYGKAWADQMGGVSGDNSIYRKMATDIIKYIYQQTKGKLLIIGVGGIKNTKTALEKIQAGATALQIVTGLDSEGPKIAGKINSGLLQYLEKEGIKSIIDIVGSTV